VEPQERPVEVLAQVQEPDRVQPLALVQVVPEPVVLLPEAPAQPLVVRPFRMRNSSIRTTLQRETCSSRL
jgi:hypothetical protein